MSKPSRTFDAFTIDGQVYTWIADHPHTRVDGRIVVMAEWQTTCRQCAIVFNMRRPERPAPPHPPRRCGSCVATDQPRALKVATSKRPSKPPLNPGRATIEAENGHYAPPSAQPPPRPPTPASGYATVPPRRTGGMNGAAVFTDR